MSWTKKILDASDHIKEEYCKKMGIKCSEDKGISRTYLKNGAIAWTNFVCYALLDYIMKLID